MTTTPFNNLPLYDTGSVADLRDAYNRSMQLIDKNCTSSTYKYKYTTQPTPARRPEHGKHHR